MLYSNASRYFSTIRWKSWTLEGIFSMLIALIFCERIKISTHKLRITFYIYLYIRLWLGKTINFNLHTFGLFDSRSRLVKSVFSVENNNYMSSLPVIDLFTVGPWFLLWLGIPVVLSRRPVSCSERVTGCSTISLDILNVTTLLTLVGLLLLPKVKADASITSAMFPFFVASGWDKNTCIDQHPIILKYVSREIFFWIIYQSELDTIDKIFDFMVSFGSGLSFSFFLYRVPRLFNLYKKIIAKIYWTR